MSKVPESDELQTTGRAQPWWKRLFHNVVPDRVARRWDRLPQGSQQDAAHYNMRSGL
ncbi:MAG: hypothetical protein WBP59_07980 [Ilumatobacteraceae bacterium]